MPKITIPEELADKLSRLAKAEDMTLQAYVIRGLEDVAGWGAGEVDKDKSTGAARLQKATPYEAELIAKEEAAKIGERNQERRRQAQGVEREHRRVMERQHPEEQEPRGRR
jgi:hypothetical protein